MDLIGANKRPRVDAGFALLFTTRTSVLPRR